MTEVEVSGPGVAKLQRKIAALDRAARGELKAQLLLGLRVGAEPIIPLVRASARDSVIPRSGGLAERVASLPMEVSASTTGYNVGVKLVVRGALAVKTNSGSVRHMVFGNPDVWVTQSIPPGWFSKVAEKEAPKVTPALKAAMQRVANKVERA